MFVYVFIIDAFLCISCPFFDYFSNNLNILIRQNKKRMLHTTVGIISSILGLANAEALYQKSVQVSNK